MRQHTRRWIDDCFSAEEANASCFVTTSNVELKRLRRAVDEGYVVELAPGVFARLAYWNDLKAASHMRHKMRGLQRLHPDWVFAGPSAALAWGLAVSNRYLDKVWVATTRKSHAKEDTYHRAIIVSHDNPVEHEGLRLTSFARTVGDSLRVTDFRSGLAVVDSALRISTLSKEELLGEIELSCERMTGIRRMRALVTLADERAESGGESIARATMLEIGFTLPDLQLAFPDPLDGESIYRVDFAWESSVSGGYIVGELDGYEKYDNPEMTGGRATSQVIADEHRRQSRLEMNPVVLRVVRFGLAEVMCDDGFLKLLAGCGVTRDYRLDAQVLAAGGELRCRL